MIEFIFNKVTSCKIQHKYLKKYNFSSFKQLIIKFWELIVFATEAVNHNCSSKWPERPATLLNRDSDAGIIL